MLTDMESSGRQRRAASVIAIAAFAILNVAFYFLSGNYFDAHHQVVAGASVPAYSPEQSSHIRATFAGVSGALIAIGFAVGLARRPGAHALAGVLGVFTLGCGFAALAEGMSFALITTLLIAGVLMPIMAWQSYRGSRTSWAFLVAMCGVFAVVAMFGTPKIRGLFHVGLWTTMLIPGLFAITAVALGRLSEDYVDREPLAA